MKRSRLAAALLPLALMLGASAASAADPAMIKARQKFFGIENVNADTGAVKKDKVIASWGTNTTYVTSLLGHVVLFDSYITRPEAADLANRSALFALVAAGLDRRSARSHLSRPRPW